MATVAKLVLEIEARTRTLQQELAGATRAINSFSRNAVRALKEIPDPASVFSPSKFGGGGARGGAIAEFQARLRAVQKDMGEAIEGFRKLREAGTLSSGEFASAVGSARRKAITAGREIIEGSAGSLGLDAAQIAKMSRAWQAAGAKSGEAFVSGRSRTIAKASRLVDRLDAQFASQTASNAISRASGGFASGKAFREKGREDAGQYNAGITSVMERFAKAGKLTEPLRQALASKLKPEGFGVGPNASANERAIAQATRTVDVLQRRFDQRVDRARFDLAKKMISPEAFDRRAFEAAQSFDKGLIRASEKMRGVAAINNAVGQVSPAAAATRGTAVGAALAQGVASGATKGAGRLRLIDHLFPDRVTAAAKGTASGKALGSGFLGALSGIGAKIKERMLPGDMFEQSFAGLQRRARAFRKGMGEESFSRPGMTNREVELDRIRDRAAIRAAQRQREQNEQMVKFWNRDLEGVSQRASRQKALQSETNRFYAGMTNREVTLQQIRERAATRQQARAALPSVGGPSLTTAALTGQRLSAALDQGMIAGARRMRGATEFSNTADRILTSKFKVLGKKNADEGVFAAKEYVAKYRDTYNRSIQSAKFAALSGDINTRQLRQATAEAGKGLATGIQAVRDRLDAEGLLTPAAIKFLNTQFANAGELAGKNFLERFHAAQKTDPIASGLNAVGSGLAQAGATLTKAFTVPIIGAGVASVKLAADAQQAATRLSISFGPAAVDLQRKLNGLRSEMPATSSELQSMASRLGELIIPLGLTGAKVAEMSTNLIRVTKNISLFAGVSTERSFNAVINGLVGQSRELKKLGIEIDDKTIRDRAYREGLARVGAQLTTTQKVHAGYLVIMERARIIEGTLQQSQGNFNVKLLFFVARLKEAGIMLGGTLLPTLTRVLNRLTALAERFATINESQLKWIVGIGLVVAALGPFLILLGNVAKALAVYRAAIIAARVATAVAGGAAAAGGALGLGSIAIAAGPAIVALLGVVTAIGLYKLAMSGASDETAEFAKKIAAMPKDALKEMAAGQESTITELLSRKRQLRQAGVWKIKDFRGRDDASGLGRIFGGDENQREEFQSVLVLLEKYETQAALVKKELEGINKMEIEGAKTAVAYKERIDSIHNALAKDLLVEVLAKAKNELSGLTAVAGAATREINVGLRTKDTKLFGEGLARAKEGLENAIALVKSFRDQMIMPENTHITKALGVLATRAEGLRARFQGLVETTEKTGSFKMFADRLGNIRAAFALFDTTKDMTALTRGHQMAAAFQIDLQTMIDEKREKGDLEAAERIQRTIDELAKIVAIANRFAPKEFIKSVDETIARLKLLRSEAGGGVITSTGIPLQDFAAADEEIQNLLDAEQVLIALIKQETAAERPTLELLRAKRRLLEEIKAATPNMFESMFGNDFLPRVQQVADAIREAMLVDKTAKIGTDESVKKTAATGVVRAQAELGQLVKDLEAKLTGLSPRLRAQVLAGFIAAFEKANGEAADFNEKVGKLDRRLMRMSLFARTVRELAEAFGFTGQVVSRLVGAVETAVQGFQQLRRVREEFEARKTKVQAERLAAGQAPGEVGKTFEESFAQISAVGSIIAASINFVQTLARSFAGDTEDRRETRKILAENNKRLEELASELSGFSLSIGNQLRVAQAISDPRVQSTAFFRSFVERDDNFGAGARGDARAGLDRELRRFGLTFADINRIAKENGIQILDGKGRLVAEAFDQLVKSIAIAREAFFTYNETLSDAQKRTALFNDVFNVPDTGQQQIEDQLRFLEKLAPALFQQFFGGIDLTNASAVEAAVQLFTNALLSGALEADETLKLLDRGELEAIIFGVAGGLDKLREATDGLTESMLNVPEWFKVNQVRFESVNPVPLTEPIPQTEPDMSTDRNPKPPPGVRPTGSFSVEGDVNFNITQQPGESTDELAARIVAHLRRDRFMRTGSTRIPGLDD